MRKEKMEHKIKKSVKDEARGTEERVSTTSENNVDNTYVKSLSISTCSQCRDVDDCRTHTCSLRKC